MPGSGDPPKEVREIGSLALREFGRRLSKVRREKGWKQVTLGNRLGLSRTSISNIERGDQRVSLELAYQAALILGVSLERLLPTLEEIAPSPGMRVSTASDAPLVPAAEEEALRLVLEVQSRRRKLRPARHLK